MPLPDNGGAIFENLVVESFSRSSCTVARSRRYTIGVLPRVRSRPCDRDSGQAGFARVKLSETLRPEVAKENHQLSEGFAGKAEQGYVIHPGIWF